MLAGLGIGGAAALLNIVVLTAVLSALNTKTYSNARMLHGMAEDGQAPKVLARTNRHGVPMVGLLVDAALVGVVVVLNYLIPGKLLMVLVAVILSAELITWSSIVVSHLYFRKRVAPHGGKFKALLHPLSNYLFLGYFGLVLVLMTRIDDFRGPAPSPCPSG